MDSLLYINDRGILTQSKSLDFLGFSKCVILPSLYAYANSLFKNTHQKILVYSWIFFVIFCSFSGNSFTPFPNTFWIRKNLTLRWKSGQYLFNSSLARFLSVAVFADSMYQKAFAYRLVRLCNSSLTDTHIQHGSIAPDGCQIIGQSLDNQSVRSRKQVDILVPTI